MADRHGWSLLMLLMTQVLCAAHGARILGLTPVPATSHQAVITSLFKELAVRGHEVTVVSCLPPDNPPANYTSIVIPLDFPKIVGKMKSGFDFYYENPYSMVLEGMPMGEKFSELTYEDKNVKELLKSKNQYDLVIIEDINNDALAGIAHVFNAPLIYISSDVGFVWTDNYVGNPVCYSYIPNLFSSFSDHMTFKERLQNTVFSLVAELYHHLIFIPRQDALMRKHLQAITNLPYLTEINKKTSLVLTNAMPGVYYPKPLLPNFIQVGGIHIKTPKPLPEDLQIFLDSAPEGVIYFSMGSFIQSADFPEPSRQSFLKVFSNLKQKIIWKFEVDNMPGQPRNVLIKKWLPQNDILAHPNVKLFITHGGLLGSQEGICYGIPIVGIPIYGDQRLNMKNAERLGYGITLEFSNITETSVKWALDEGLNNPRYTERAKAVSRIFHDQPQTAMERAVYWTEYVIRHKGAPHLRSAAVDLTWYQYLLLDVVAVILLIVVAVVALIVLSCKKLFGSRKDKAISAAKKKN